VEVTIMEQLELDVVNAHEEELERKLQAQDAAIERERIEQVFGLTGGELSDEPWSCESREEAKPDRVRTFHSWYEGVPEYAKRDFPDLHDTSYRTVISCCLFGAEPEVLEDEEDRWYRVASFSSSGETTCSWEGCEDADENLPCKICEGDDKHGMIYIGDGWSETVFKIDVVREIMES
jgi:hypothetical protein